MRPNRVRPFLVLPSLESNMPKNPGLKLFTKTWPPKRDGKSEEIARPLTATLEKPTILDISYINKIDMSKVRKEFLNISNLCRMPIIIKTRRNSKTPRPLSLPPTEKRRKKKLEVIESDENSIKSASNLKIAKARSKLDKINKKVLNDANNNSACAVKLTKKLGLKEVKDKEKLPEPCKACGRPDQPERFHSHPATPLKPPIKSKESPLKIPVKSSVQKPVAMKYKSKQGEVKATEVKPRKGSLPTQRIVHTPPDVPISAETPRPVSARRFLTCYICGRDFGTASLPLHEPKCLEKWKRENAKLPPNQQKSPPVRPKGNLTDDKWNAQAQKSCKEVRAVPEKRKNSNCYICGKSFSGSTIELHELECLAKWNDENDSLPADIRSPPPRRKAESDGEVDGRPVRKTPLFPCYVCGRMFTVETIYQHEPICLKHWKAENDKLPEGKRKQQPLKCEIKFTDEGKIDFKSANEDKYRSYIDHLIPCKRCGRTFNPDRVGIHEKSCKG